MGEPPLPPAHHLGLRGGHIIYLHRAGTSYTHGAGRTFTGVRAGKSLRAGSSNRFTLFRSLSYPTPLGFTLIFVLHVSSFVIGFSLFNSFSLGESNSVKNKTTIPRAITVELDINKKTLVIICTLERSIFL